MRTSKVTTSHTVALTLMIGDEAVALATIRTIIEQINRALYGLRAFSAGLEKIRSNIHSLGFLVDKVVVLSELRGYGVWATTT